MSIWASLPTLQPFTSDAKKKEAGQCIGTDAQVIN
jgi:hypothetical protein